MDDREYMGLRAKIAAAVLIIIVLAVILVTGKKYTEYMDVSGLDIDSINVSLDNEDAMTISDYAVEEDLLTVTIHGIGRGYGDLIAEDGDGKRVDTILYSNSTGWIRNMETMNFSGQRAVLIAIVAYGIFLFCLMVEMLSHKHKTGHYSYTVIYCVGFSFMVVSILASQGYFLFKSIRQPVRYTVRYMLNALSISGHTFITISMPVLTVIAAGLVISNLILIKHEGFRIRNGMGIAAAFALTIGGIIEYILAFLVEKGTASVYLSAFANVYAFGFAYMECMMLGTIICAVLISLREPAYTKDYVVILGAKFRKDGTLYPLLKGRVDRAIAFYKAQEAASGKAPILIPSGGQGPDEPMPEADAMTRYLIEQGIPEDHIMPERKSATTRENLLFSKRLIEDREQEIWRREGITDVHEQLQRLRHLRKYAVVFSTSSYHVLRGEILSYDVGVETEGIGSKTRWYMWPNATIREFIGLLYAEKRSIIMTLTELMILVGALTLMID